MFEQTELPGTQMAPNGPPNAQQERLNSPRNRQFSKIRPFGSFWPFGQNFHFGHFGQPFPNQGGHAEKKFYSGSCLHQRDLAASEFSGN